MIGKAPTQAEKGKAFRALYERDSAFIIPNPCDTSRGRDQRGVIARDGVPLT
jgi:hypothetical protein